MIYFDIFCYVLMILDDLVIRFNVTDKVKRLILLLNKIRFEKKIKYLVMG